ncbi:hypothetical protein [Streptomyces sp. NPDC020141]|uniref:hypothetical protein n=1 Tax=Streptomyces sp. NPDC020141 TaxID=3365065 RepID=UPI0037B3B27C
MPSTDAYAQEVPYPLLSDSPDIETAMRSLVNGVVPLTVMRFANYNERAATLTGSLAPVPGMVVYLRAEDRWEAYQADKKWLLLSDGPWRPFQLIAGYSAQGGSPGWRLKAGGGVELRGRIRRSNGGNLVDDGNIVTFANIPQSITPGATRYYIVSTNRMTTGSVTHYTARVEVSSSGELRYTVEKGGGTAEPGEAPWFCLDGIQFSPEGD